MVRCILILIALAVPTFSVAGSPSMDCSNGPLERTFGGTEWVVYGCSDGKSVVIVTAQGNPGGPFYFMMFPESEGYRLYGEGTGNKEATQAAYNELAALLSPDFVASLHASATRASVSVKDGDRPN